MTDLDRGNRTFRLSSMLALPIIAKINLLFPSRLFWLIGKNEKDSNQTKWSLNAGRLI